MEGETIPQPEPQPGLLKFHEAVTRQERYKPPDIRHVDKRKYKPGADVKTPNTLGLFSEFKTPIEQDVMGKELAFVFEDNAVRELVVDFLKENYFGETNTLLEILSKKETTEAEREFFFDFVRWLLGVPNEEDRKKTPWLDHVGNENNKLVRKLQYSERLKYIIPGAEVHAFLQLIQESRERFRKQLEILKVNFPLNGQGSLLQAYLYFKYLIRMDDRKWLGDLDEVLSLSPADINLSADPGDGSGGSGGSGSGGSDPPKDKDPPPKGDPALYHSLSYSLKTMLNQIEASIDQYARTSPEEDTLLHETIKENITEAHNMVNGNINQLTEEQSDQLFSMIGIIQEKFKTAREYKSKEKEEEEEPMETLSPAPDLVSAKDFDTVKKHVIEKKVYYSSEDVKPSIRKILYDYKELNRLNDQYNSLELKADDKIQFGVLKGMLDGLLTNMEKIIVKNKKKINKEFPDLGYKKVTDLRKNIKNYDILIKYL